MSYGDIMIVEVELPCQLDILLLLIIKVAEQQYGKTLVLKCVRNKGISLVSSIHKNHFLRLLNVDGKETKVVNTIRRNVVCFSSGNRAACKQLGLSW